MGNYLPFARIVTGAVTDEPPTPLDLIERRYRTVGFRTIILHYRHIAK
jgi:hypothetical protein